MENYWGIIIILILVYIIFKFTKNYLYKKSLASTIFEKILIVLKTASSITNIENGLTEDQIVNIYARECGMSENEFKIKILPFLREMRKKSSKLREFEKNVNGRYKIAWQWAD